MNERQLQQWRIQRLTEMAAKAGGNALLGRMLGYKDGAYIGQMLRGERPISEKFVIAAHEKPGFSGWFNVPSNNKKTNIERFCAAHGPYPLISNVQAGEWGAIVDKFTVGDAKEWMVSPVNLGDQGFILRISDSSMTHPHLEDSFPEGWFIHINPDIKPKPGDFVIVKRAQDADATFRQLKIVDGERYLHAINPQWPNPYIKLEDGDVFIGVMKFAGKAY